jgi:hypothetical protein
MAKKLQKKTANIPENIPHEIPADEMAYIAPDLRPLAVAVDSLFPDTQNARKHDDRNKQAVRGLLLQYGQLIPIVVDKATRVIIKGNCTYEETISLGRKYIAANFVDFTPGQGIAFGLDDNRAGELGKWDYQVAAENIRELQEFEEAILLHAWSKDEIEPLLEADWQPAPVDGSVDDHGLKAITGDGAPPSGSTPASAPASPAVAAEAPISDNAPPSEHDAGKAKPLIVTPAQRETIDRAIETLRLNEGDGQISEGRCIELICAEWLSLCQPLEAGSEEAEDE